ncbi:LOW QUALITY PROTEIN: hypothetical protein HZS_3541 [Henneguya salminicola]|nr:LOW QUALITY PROTEIN: hypothetical protein HZS_3541 [Henneguya salminicola]
MSPPLSLKRNRQPFFRLYFIGDIHREKHRIIVESVLYNTAPPYPSPFFQCVVVMAYDCGTELYVLCAFTLWKKRIYILGLLHQLMMLMEYILMPRAINTDFEKAFLSAVKQEFPKSRILGYYFHLKQALFH